MNKQETIEFLKKDHQKLKEVIDSLSPQQMTEVSVIEKWTVKDILAHISAWNSEEVKAIDEVLANRKPWYVGVEEDEFNRREVEKRRSWPLGEVLKEWEDSFAALVEKVGKLSIEEWAFETNHTWSDGTLLTLSSLFKYEYEGAGHEGGHARQIKARFNVSSS